MLKAVLRSSLPPAVAEPVSRLKERLTVATMPAARAAIDRLTPAATLDPARLFASPDLAAHWRHAEPAIAALLPAQDLDLAVCPGERRALYYLARGLGARSVLEVGTHIGASTLHIAAALRDLGRTAPEPPLRLVTVDILDVNDSRHGPWRQHGLSRPPAELMGTFGVADLVTFVARPSLAYLATCPHRFDLIFLDGNHAGPTVYREIAAASALLNQGGTILVHDVYPDHRPLFPGSDVIQGPWLAITRHRRENPRLRPIPLGNLPWPTKQGVKASSLCLLAAEPT